MTALSRVSQYYVGFNVEARFSQHGEFFRVIGKEYDFVYVQMP